MQNRKENPWAKEISIEAFKELNMPSTIHLA